MPTTTIKPPKGFRLEIKPPDGFVLEQPKDVNDTYLGLEDPNEIRKRAGEILDISVKLDIPTQATEDNYRAIKNIGTETIYAEPLTPEEQADEERHNLIIYMQEHPELIKRLQQRTEEQLIKEYFTDLPEPKTDYEAKQRESRKNLALKGYEYWRKVYLARAKRAKLKKLREDDPKYQEEIARYEELRRSYKSFWDELRFQVVGGGVRLTAGALVTLAQASESAIWDKDKMEETAQFLYELGERPEMAMAKGGDWRKYVATVTGQASAYMGAAALATATSGTSLGAFSVAFMAEGGDSYLKTLQFGGSREQALTNLFIVGTINGTLEKLQIDRLWRFAKVGKATKNAVLRNATQRAWRKMLTSGKEITFEYLQLICTEATQESLQEITSIAAESRVNPEVWGTAIERVLSAGGGGATVSGLMGFGGRIGNLSLKTKTDTIVNKYNERIKSAQERKDIEVVRSLMAMEQNELSQMEGIPDQPTKPSPEVKEKITPVTEPIIGVEKGEVVSQRPEAVEVAPEVARGFQEHIKDIDIRDPKTKSLMKEVDAAYIAKDLDKLKELYGKAQELYQNTKKSKGLSTLIGVVRADVKETLKAQPVVKPKAVEIGVKKAIPTREELYEIYEQTQAAEEKTDREILGNDLEKYNRAQRRLGSMNDKVVERAEDVIEEIEAKLTKAEINKLYGIGEKGRTAEDLRTELNARDDVADALDEGNRDKAIERLERFASDYEWARLALERIAQTKAQPIAKAEPWEMTRAEFVETVRGTPTPLSEMPLHRIEVEKAVKRGKTVRAEVLEDYKSKSWAKEALAKLKAEPVKPKGKLDVTPLLKVHKTFMGVIEPSKAVEKKVGKDPYAAVIKGVQTDVGRLEFNQAELVGHDKTIEELGEWFDKFPDKDLRNLMLSRGHPSSVNAELIQRDAINKLPKELQGKKVQNAIEQIANFNYQYLQKVAGDDINKVADYFYGIYKDAKKVDKFLDYWRTTKRFTKEKKIPTVADAVDYGLELRNYNPVKNLQAEYLAIAHLEGMNWLKDELLRTGKGKFIDDFIEAPLEWDKVQDPVFRGLRLQPDLAKMINNLIATNKITKVPLLNTLRQTNNFLRTIKFIGSAFHLISVTKQSIADSGYLGFLYKKTALRGFTTGFRKDDPIFRTPFYKRYVSLGGGHHYAVESEARRAFSQAVNELNTNMGKAIKVGALPLKIPVTFVDWMFQSYIPKVKYTKTLDWYNKQSKKLGRELTDAELVDIIKEGQNFYGMMNERLFGRSGTVTTVMRFWWMSPSYAEGNYRTMLKSILQWGGKEGFDANRSRSNIINSWLLTATAATIGTMILTGKPPKKPETLDDARDLFKIDTGKVDEKGRRIMIDLMTYDKDYWNVAFNTLRLRPDIAIGKSWKRLGGMKAPTADMIVDLAEMAMGRAIYDWKGDRIYHITDPFLQKVMKLTIHEVKKLEPISMSVFKQSRERDIDKTIAAIETLLGLRPAKTEADKREQELLTQMFSLRGQREEMSWWIGKSSDPLALIENYNKTVNDILESPYVPETLKKEWGPKLYIDENKIVLWKNYPIDKFREELKTMSKKELDEAFRGTHRMKKTPMEEVREKLREGMPKGLLIKSQWEPREDMKEKAKAVEETLK